MKTKQRKKSNDSNVKFGNAFHRRIRRLLESTGMDITLSTYTGEGPDIIARDKETKTKIIVQCKATKNAKTYPTLSALINEYAERRRELKADLALIVLSKYKIKDKIDLVKTFKKKKVRVITDEQIKEYEELVGKLHHFAKYQILADLGVTKKFSKDRLKVPAFKIAQPGHDFLVTSMPIEWLLKTASVYRRVGPEKHVKGYQRILSKKRVTREIPKYLNETKWVLPNAIICATQLEGGGRLSFSRQRDLILPPRVGFLWVIDGQHRLYSFANAPSHLQERLLTVIFDSSRLGEQPETVHADMFMKLNRHAQRISRALVLELLMELLGTKDEEVYLKVAFKLCKTRPLGPIVRGYSKHSGLIDIVTLSSTQPIVQLSSKDGLIVRKRSMDADKRAALVASYIASYFRVVAKVFKKEWDNPEYIISENRGIRIFLRILVHILRENRDASRSRILKIARSSLVTLKKKRTFEVDALRGQGLGEGGANVLARDWIAVMSGADTDADIPRREGKHVEFKETFRWSVKDSQVNRELRHEISKSISAFQNTEGGSVYVGIDDNGRLMGIERDLTTFGNSSNQEDGLDRFITQTLTEDLGFQAASQIDVQWHRKGEKQFIQLSALPSREVVYFRRGGFYIRNGAAKKYLTGQDGDEYIRARKGRFDR